MSKFNKWEFINIINELEKQEVNEENHWLGVGILEYMYDDDNGWIDEYFNIPYKSRKTQDVYNLWDKIEKNFDK